MKWVYAVLAVASMWVSADYAIRSWNQVQWWGDMTTATMCLVAARVFTNAVKREVAAEREPIEEPESGKGER